MDFGTNLAPFGEGLGAKMRPSRHQIAPKIDLQIDDKIDSLSDRSRERFASILGPNWDPNALPTGVSNLTF